MAVVARYRVHSTRADLVTLERLAGWNGAPFTDVKPAALKKDDGRECALGAAVVQLDDGSFALAAQGE